ncbi:tetraacyldisaccharide 4'-kinase [Paraferrimonas sp. SM1919]|uniref:tetraacyldisaccharide 4'-kinase n=1 Tax=Paraferrimonas sp. SM1919 TaxID=2662263 RepID=UPI0013D85A5C|nr:tetraacyldisaccharide 4'-kinase [Paraferrimonas sp. SM1919]
MDQIWYQKKHHPISYSLYPLSALFALLTKARRWLYRKQWLKSHQVDIPVVVVGNINVGGTGKTPTVIALIELLRKQGFNPGVISRGYGGNYKEKYKLLSKMDSPERVGDEPAMIYASTKAPVIVSKNRVLAAKVMSEIGADIIISDDGLQHYALARDIEIIVVDGKRRFGNKRILPAGPLREPIERVRIGFGAHPPIVLVNGGEPLIDKNIMTLLPQPLVGLSETASLPQAGDAIAAFAGIGNPKRFHTTLEQLGFKVEVFHAFSDHKSYKTEDFNSLLETQLNIVMTEKDAIKCRNIPSMNKASYLPVVGGFNQSFKDSFTKQLRKITDGI